MLETKEQKGTLVIVVLLILMLSVVSLWDRQGFKPQNQQSGQPTEDNFLKSQAYLNYLNSLEIDKSASDKLFKEILSEEEIKQEVEKALKVDQEIQIPQIAESSLNVSSGQGQEAVENYLSAILGDMYDFNSKTYDLNSQLFSEDQSGLWKLKSGLESFYNKIKEAQTPKEALSMHKALLVSYAAYGDLIESSENFADGDQKDPWPEVYKNYVIILTSLFFQPENKIRFEFVNFIGFRIIPGNIHFICCFI